MSFLKKHVFSSSVYILSYTRRQGRSNILFLWLNDLIIICFKWSECFLSKENILYGILSRLLFDKHFTILCKANLIRLIRALSLTFAEVAGKIALGRQAPMWDARELRGSLAPAGGTPGVMRCVVGCRPAGDSWSRLALLVNQLERLDLSAVDFATEQLEGELNLIYFDFCIDL